MKNIKSFFCLMLMLVGLAACTSDENLQPANKGDNAGASIRFTLGGSAKTAASRATIAAEDNERAVNSVLAVLFDTHKGFYKSVEARNADEAYEVLVEDDATYDIYFVANADTDLRSDLENIADTTQAIYAKAAFQKIIATQAPDANAFLMISTTPKRVTTTITKTEDLGTVALTRLSARFDIVNKADGVTVNKVTFKNRAVKASLRQANYMPLNEAGLFETKTYSDLALSGNSEMPGAYRHEIYSYRNVSLDPDSIPTLTIEYTETTAEGATVEREHIVKFIDPNAPAGTPLTIGSNKLYTITLTKAYKLEFNLSVEDWNEAETFNITDLEVKLDPKAQDELNKKLLVYDLFSDNYTASIDVNAKTATFLPKLMKSKEMPEGAYFSCKTLSDQGLFKEDAILTVDGEQYRIPTIGELQLLMPKDDRYVADNQNPEPIWTKPSFGGARWSGELFTETVYMKNGADYLPLVTESMDDPTVAFTGESQIRVGSEPKQTFIDNTTGYYCDGTSEDCTAYTRYSCYAIRFKGSSQYSAYKWEPAVCDENGVYYVSVKIKALPEGFNLNVYDITDNYSFWREGYIEIKIPYTGYLYSSNLTLGNPYAFYVWASSKVPGITTNNYYFAGGNNNSLYIDRSGNTYRPVRLVKVKNQTAE